MNDSHNRPERPRRTLTSKKNPKPKQEQLELGAELEDEASAPAAGPIKAPDESDVKSLQNSFLIAIVIGIAGAVGGYIPGAKWLGFLGPLAAITGFFVWGLYRGFGKQSDTRQQFADSCYFLGFLLTMVAMLVGFFPAGMLNQQLGSPEILRHFSMALGATALGLIFRIVVLQGARSVGQVAAQVETELTKYARKVTEEAKAISGEIAGARAALAEERSQLTSLVTNDLRSAVAGAFEPIGKHAAAISEQLGEQSRLISNSAQQLQQSLNQSSNQLAVASGISSEAQETAGDAIASVTDTLNQFALQMAALQQQMDGVITSTSSAIGRMAGAFDGSSKLAPELTPALERVQQDVDRVASQFSTLEQSGAALSNDIQRVLDDDGRLVEGVAEAQEAIVARLRSEAEKLGSGMTSEGQRAQQQLEQHRQLLGQECQRAVEQMKVQADQFQAKMATVTEQLTQILNGFSQRLIEARR